MIATDAPSQMSQPNLPDPVTQPEPVRLMGALCIRELDKARKSRKRAMDTGREIMRYAYAPNYNFEYAQFTAPGWAKACVRKTAEAFQYIVPGLLQATPNRLLTPRDPVNPIKYQRAQVTQALLNYTPPYTDLYKYSRRATEECVAYGRGVLWHGRDPRTGLFGSTFDSVRNLFIDGNVKLMQDAHLVIRRRERPKWELIDENPECAQIIQKLPLATKNSEDDSRYDWETPAFTPNVVRYYEFYFNVGIHNFDGGEAILKAQSAQAGTQGTMTDQQAKDAAMTADETPKLYLVAEDGTVICVKDWPIPYHLMPDDPWPCTVLDFYDNPDSLWPASMMEPGLCFQRYMNYIVTLLMQKFEYTSKTVLAIAKNRGTTLTPKAKEKVTQSKTGTGLEYIEVEMNGEVKDIRELIQQWDYNNDYIEPALRLLAEVERKFERATGMQEFLLTGESGTQDRSALATQVKDRNSRTRIEDMRDRQAAFQTLCSRKEAFGSRFVLQAPDIQKWLGPEAAQAWGFLAPNGSMDQNGQPNPQYWLQQGAMAGIPPAQIAPWVQQQMAQSVTLDEIVWETMFTIESGSIRRKDIDQQLDILKELNNQVTPLQLQSPDPLEKSAAYTQLAAYYKLAGMPDELVQEMKGLSQHFGFLSQAMMNMPPVPPGTGAPGKPAPKPKPQGAPQ